MEDRDPPRGPAFEQKATLHSQRSETVVGGAGTNNVPRQLSGTFSGIYESIGRCARVGRDSQNDVVVDDALVSRFHAELRTRPDGRRELVDLGSANGTYVNGRAVERAIVEELDIVSVGHHTFRLVGERLEEYVDTGTVTFEARNLNVRASSGQPLLHDVSFRLERCSFLAMIGPSGAGKSTLLNALTGFRPATEGRVLYDGRDLYSEYDELRMRLGFVPQEDILHGSLTVGQALDYGVRLRFPRDVSAAERRGLIAEVLAQLGIADATDLPIHRLSGGQRRRVAVAMELVTKPSLLFLDEPTSGLDPGNERSTMRLLRELADDGRTVIAVTHSMQSIRLCDRLLVLATGGRPAYFGRPQLAPACFGCDDLQEVFQLLNADRDRDWSAQLTTGAAGASGASQRRGGSRSTQRLLGNVTPQILHDEATRFDPTLTATAALPDSQLGASSLQQLLGAWRSESWNDAKRLLAASAPAQRATVAHTIEVGAAGRARLIAALTSTLVIGPDAARRDAYCKQQRSKLQ